MSDNEYRCRDCATRTDSFVTACSNCGANSFAHVLDRKESEGRDVTAEVAKLSRPLNPLVPA
jgi:predicted  nucleic acid-binding Zn-ribbon protein